MSQCALNLRHILYANAVSSQWLQCDQKLNKNSKPNKAFKKIKKICAYCICLNQCFSIKGLNQLQLEVSEFVIDVNFQKQKNSF